MLFCVVVVNLFSFLCNSGSHNQLLLTLKILSSGTSLLLFQGLQRILGLRKYDGSINFVPAPGYESYGEPLDLEKEVIIEAETETKSYDEPVKPHDSGGYHGPKVDIKSLNWRKIDGPFISIWLHNVPWGGEDTMAAPDAQVLCFSYCSLCYLLTKIN